MKKEIVMFEGIEVVIEVSDNGEKTVSINGKEANINFNGTRLATIESKVNLGKIYDFVNKHKYEDDEIKTTDDTTKGITLLIEGYEFYGHWEEKPNKDTNILSLNEFIPSYEAIISALEDLDDEISSQFLSPKYYEDDFKDFIRELEVLGITTYENSQDDYDVLTTFCLPANKLDNEKFLKDFMNIFTAYKNKYEEELSAIY